VTPEGAFSPPVSHRHLLQKGKRQWLAKISVLTQSVLVEIFCPSENSSRDEDYINWMDEILDNLAEEKFAALQVVTHLGPNKIKHNVYTLSDSPESE
jgi:hypothetical protein